MSMKLLGQIIHAAPSFKDLEKRIAAKTKYAKYDSIDYEADIDLTELLSDDVQEALREMEEVSISTEFDTNND